MHLEILLQLLPLLLLLLLVLLQAQRRMAPQGMAVAFLPLVRRMDKLLELMFRQWIVLVRDIIAMLILLFSV